ncbi:TRAP transporter small permease [Thalassovita sp.]|jgi:TRAP-type C4-dicarboxylate transport system permease small subunit|uniref:TRAP transporter small permease n=1 Tax=Thalassovita sp. TaxID=1979401 RepID=UPI003B5B773F
MPLTSILTPLARAYLAVIRIGAGLSMALITVIMVVQVFARYVLGDSLIWAEELCRYLLIWQTFLVLGVAYSRGDFVSLDFVPDMLNARGEWVLRAVMAVPILLFLWVMAMHGADYASRFDRQTIPAVDFIWESLFDRPLGMSIKYVYYAVTVGLLLMAVHVVADVVIRFRPQFLGQGEITPFRLFQNDEGPEA